MKKIKISFDDGCEKEYEIFEYDIDNIRFVKLNLTDGKILYINECNILQMKLSFD